MATNHEKKYEIAKQLHIVFTVYPLKWNVYRVSF